jgi:hypothetical protein
VGWSGAAREVLAQGDAYDGGFAFAEAEAFSHELAGHVIGDADVEAHGQGLALRFSLCHVPLLRGLAERGRSVLLNI